MSIRNFSKPKVSPPSSHPAACTIIEPCARTAAQSALAVSAAPCASAAQLAAPAAVRKGRPTWRASWPAPRVSFTGSGAPKAGAPDFMPTFEAKPPFETGAPGRAIRAGAIPDIASACWRVIAPATEIGAIAPARQKG